MNKPNNKVKIKFNLSEGIQKELKKIKAISKIDAAQSMAKRFEELNKAHSLSFQSATSKIAESIKIYEASVGDRISNMLKSEIGPIAQIFAENKKAVERIRLNQLGTISAIFRNMDKMQPDIAGLRAITESIKMIPPKTALGTIPNIQFDLNINYPASKWLAEQVETIDAASIDEIELENYFDEIIKRQSGGSVSAQGLSAWLDRMVTYFILLFTLVQTMETGEQLETIIKQNKKSIEQRQTQIEEQKTTNAYLDSLENFTEKAYIKIDSLIDPDKKENLVLVKKESTIRNKPNTKSDSLATVYKQQILDVEKEVNHWLRVKYFDHIETLTKTGWIAKRNVTDYNRH